MALELADRSRKFILESRSSLENTRGLRLSYARWIIIAGLVGLHLLEQNMLPTLDTGYLLIGAYALFNLGMWVISFSFGKGNMFIVSSSLLGDIILTTITSYYFQSPVYYIPYVFSLLIIVLIGVGEGVTATLLVAVVNGVIYSLKGPVNIPLPPINPNLIGAALVPLLFGAALFIINNSPLPITKLQDKVVEEALERISTTNLEEMQNRVKAIYRVARTLSQSLDYQKVIEGILGELQTIFDVYAGVVLLFDEQGELKVAHSVNLKIEETEKPLKIGNSILREMVMKGEPTLIEEKEHFNQIYNLFPSFQACRSAILMPLRSGFEVFGVVIITSLKEKAYLHQDLEWVVALTSHPVVSLQNAKLYNSILADRNRMIRDVEEIRHTLARNLHDGPAQAVAAFSMQAEFIHRLIKTDSDKAVQEVVALGKQAIQTSKEIRNLLFELRPLALETSGLDGALEQYSARFPINPEDPKVHFSAGNFKGRLAPNVETTIFTVLQEAVNNARKHARAGNIWLNLQMKEGFIYASAQDDGAGFDIKAVETNYEKRGSLGMTNMRERAALVNGSVKLESHLGRGTIVALRIPLNEANTIVPPKNLPPIHSESTPSKNMYN